MITFLIIIFAFRCESSKDTSIVPLTMFNYADTTMNKGREIINRIDYYLIKNYSYNRRTQRQVDSFAHTYNRADTNSYGEYRMFFYKQSSKTNVEHLSTNPRDLDRYSQDHDLIYKYTWINGKFMVRYKFRNGEIIEPKHKIELEEIK